MSWTDLQFDAALDAHQEREREMAEERAVVGDEQAERPEAERFEITFGVLQVGDFMTAEEGPRARWVEVTAIAERQVPDEDEEHSSTKLAITFRTPQPLGVGMHDEWVIDRWPSESVVIDKAARAARQADIPILEDFADKPGEAIF